MRTRCLLLVVCGAPTSLKRNSAAEEFLFSTSATRGAASDTLRRTVGLRRTASRPVQCFTFFVRLSDILVVGVVSCVVALSGALPCADEK